MTGLASRWHRMADAHLGLLLAGLNIGLGLVLILGGPLRTSSATFNTARTVMPIHAWGALFLACGLAGWALIRAPRWGRWVLVLGTTVYSFWGAAFFLAAVNNKAAGLTGIVAYLWLAMLHLLAGSGMAREVRRDHPEA